MLKVSENGLSEHTLMFTYQKKFLIISDSNKDRFIEKETDQTLNDDGYTCWLETLSKISLICNRCTIYSHHKKNFY